ncbi:MAG TPA: hypothetical protein VEC39_05180 [Vicinamibacterales bacterium]|nr:hypothetical protein [Vicinamibacterales bacterium]
MRRFMQRDWHRVDAAKASYWRALKHTRPAADLFAAADALRQHALTVHPSAGDWRSREDDIAVHVRVAEALRAVARRPR